MSKFVKFIKVKVTNPNTNEVSERLRVVSEDNKEYNLLTDMPIEDIKANRADLLTKVIVQDGPYKPYAVFRNSEILEEF